MRRPSPTLARLRDSRRARGGSDDTRGSSGAGNGRVVSSSAAASKTRRAPITYEEVAAAADAIAGSYEKVTIERVRQAVGGGGNQAVMEHLGRWRELRRRGAQFGAGVAGGLMSEALKAALSQVIDEEIKRQREAAEDVLRERHDESVEARKALEEDLKTATSAAFGQEQEVTELREQLAEQKRDFISERQAAALMREKLSGRVETLEERNCQQQAELAKHYEAAIEARGKDASQVAQIESLSGEVKMLCEALDRARADIFETQ